MTQFYNKSVAITPSDSADIPAGPPEAIYVGGAGVVVAAYADGTLGTFTCIAGQVLPIKCKRINSTNTTATLLVALYRV